MEKIGCDVAPYCATRDCYWCVGEIPFDDSSIRNVNMVKYNSDIGIRTPFALLAVSWCQVFDRSALSFSSVLVLFTNELTYEDLHNNLADNCYKQEKHRKSTDLWQTDHFPHIQYCNYPPKTNTPVPSAWNTFNEFVCHYILLVSYSRVKKL